MGFVGQPLPLRGVSLLSPSRRLAEARQDRAADLLHAMQALSPAMAPNSCQQAALDICGRLSFKRCHLRRRRSNGVLLDEARATSSLRPFRCPSPDDIGHVIVAFLIVLDEGRIIIVVAGIIIDVDIDVVAGIRRIGLLARGFRVGVTRVRRIRRPRPPRSRAPARLRSERLFRRPPRTDTGRSEPLRRCRAK